MVHLVPVLSSCTCLLMFLSRLRAYRRRCTRASPPGWRMQSSRRFLLTCFSSYRSASVARHDLSLSRCGEAAERNHDGGRRGTSIVPGAAFEVRQQGHSGKVWDAAERRVMRRRVGRAPCRWSKVGDAARMSSNGRWR
jgi:hypothetical protein